MRVRSGLWAAAAGLAVLTLATGLPADASTVVKSVRGLTIQVDTTHARPGGLLVVRAQARRPLGFTRVVLYGRRVPAHRTRDGRRALVGVPIEAQPGPTHLGIEIRGRRGWRRISLDVTIKPHSFPERNLAFSPAQRALIRSRQAQRDSRRVLAALRMTSDVAHWHGRFQPPVRATAERPFGTREHTPGDLPFNRRFDALYGEHHRGLDYSVPIGTVVQAPAAGIVLLADALVVTGQTVVIDHGQGLLSVLAHLGRIDVREGQWIEGRTPIGLSGQSGIAPSPHVHWGTYVHTIPLDPSLLLVGSGL